MTLRMTNRAWILVLLATGACGGPPKVDAPSGAAPVANSDPAAVNVAVQVQDAGAPHASVQDAAVPEAAAPEHPFAATPAEATTLIDDAINARVGDLARCVETARARRKNPHQKISVMIGIDQQGHLMAVTAPPGGQKDPELFACVQGVLTGANFPTSHAGVITVTRSFEEQAVYK
jgi:hypothetical protein